MAEHRQTSFSAGELSPLLWGRNDLELYGKGARTLKNYFISKQGSSVSRPGTLKVATAKLADVALIPFIYSDTEAFILELGENYLRVLALDGTLVFETIAVWRASEVRSIQYAQAGYVLTLTHKSFPPLELRAPQPGVSATWVFVEARFTPPGDSPTDVQSLTPVFKDVGGNLRLSPMLVGGVTLFTLDAAHPPREWKYLVSSILRHNITGEEIETLPVAILQYFDGVSAASVTNLPTDNLLVLYPDAPIILRNPLFGPTVGTLSDHVNWSPVGTIFYRGRGNLFGFIGTTRYAQDFVDVGEEPNYSRQPLRGEAPFQPAGLSSYSPKPAAVAFFQQRRAFALDQRVAISATDEWANHDRPIPPFIVDSSPLDYTFIGRLRESARSLVGHRRLLIFSDTSVWSLGAGDDGALTPAGAAMRLEDECGSAALMPLVVDGLVLYVRAKGRGVRALSLVSNGDSTGYSVKDASWFAEHLFRTETIISWCFQRDPWGVVWAVRSDGVLLSLSRSGDGVLGWARHVTGERIEGTETVFDQFLSVCCVPSGQADVVFAAVKRGANTFIERFYIRENQTPVVISEDMADADFAVDCSVSDEVAVDVAETITGLGELEGRDVWVTAPANPPQGPYRVTGGQITIDPFSVENDPGTGNVGVIIGLAFTADLGTLDAPFAHISQKTTVKVGFEVDTSRGGLELGEEEDRLHPWRSRATADDYGNPAAASVLAVVSVSGKWQRSGRAFLRQPKPIATTILGITREVAVGGK